MGTGVQARSHGRLLRKVRDFEEVRVWGRDPERARACAAEIGAKSCPSAEDAARGAVVVVTATAAKDPIVRGEWLKPGAHVGAVGWNGLDGRELDDATMRATVLVESREAALAESGNVIMSGATVFAELGEVFAGHKTVDCRETTVFISTGLAVEYAYAVGLLLPGLLDS